MTRVLVDCRYVRVGPPDGITRYTAGIATELAALMPEITLLISDPRQRAHLPDIPWLRGPSPTSPLEPFVGWRLRRHGFDVVFSPMQTMGSLGRRHALILTVHDLIYYEHRTPPRWLPWPVRLGWRLYHYAWWPQRVLLNRADAVVTVSHTTAGLIRQHRLTRRPVVVVPNAADTATEPGAEPTADAAEPTPESATPPPREPPTGRDLLYMGAFLPYKGVATLARAMEALPEYTLHLLSRIAPAERDRLTALAPPGSLVFHDGVGDAEYQALLLRATALVSASRAEGFGIPLIEAQRAGTPVVVSDIPIFREVGESAATYFAPEEAGSFERAVRSLEAPGVWAQRSRAGATNAARYSWRTSAAVLRDALEDAVAAHRRDRAR